MFKYDNSFIMIISTNVLIHTSQVSVAISYHKDSGSNTAKYLKYCRQYVLVRNVVKIGGKLYVISKLR